MVRWLLSGACLLGTGGLLTGCLTAPALKDCVDFPIAETIGNEACGGDACTIYCEALVDICPDTVPGDQKVAACKADCGEFADPNPAIDCRLGQLRLARTDPTACDSASIGGGSECGVSQCDEYCFLLNRDCPDSFSSPEQCLQACAAIPTGGSGLAGNSIECRLRKISENPDACDAASIASDGTCGTACDGYCTQVMANCTDAQQVFESFDACIATCAFMPVGNFNDWSLASGGLNSVMCRAYHASAPASVNPATHCPHASLYFDQECGSICDTYCAAEMCGGEFANTEACVAACAEQINAGTPLFPDPAADPQCTPAPAMQ